MPSAPPRICSRCKGTKPGTCKCTVRVDYRESAAKRGYGYRWQQFRAAYLAEHPLCEDCMTPDPLETRHAFVERQGTVRPATDVHHKAKVIDRPDLKYDRDNVMALCHECHSKRTKRGE